MPEMLNLPQPDVLTLRANGEFHFVLDPRITDPATYRTAFIILLDGDLVMSPEHLGVASMAAVLRRAGFSVRIFEIEHERETRVLQELTKYAPNLACFTLMSLNMPSCISFCEALKESLPNICIACGGPAGTYATREVLEQARNVDIVAVGEGEPTIFDLVQRLYLGESFEGCPGICYRASDGTVHQNAVRHFIHNLDDLPFLQQQLKDGCYEPHSIE